MGQCGKRIAKGCGDGAPLDDRGEELSQGVTIASKAIFAKQGEVQDLKEAGVAPKKWQQ